MKPEGSVKADVKKVLEDLGLPYYMPGASIYTKTGMADFMTMQLNGRVLLIETKADKKKPPTAIQADRLKEWCGAGATGAIIDKDNVQHLREWILAGCPDDPDDKHGFFRWKKVEPVRVQTKK